MNLIVKYFGAIAELTGTTEELLNIDEVGSQVSQVKAYCEKKYAAISGQSYQLSLNKKLVTEGELTAGDEIAFLPPFAGG